MALKEFKKIESSNSELTKIQENIKSFTSQLNKAVLSGLVIENVSIGTATTMVPHGLARDYQGWQLLDVQGDARVWRDATVDASLPQNGKDKFLPLKASVAVTVKLWVF